MPLTREEGKMQKQFMLIVVAAIVGAIIAFSADIGPPFHEGPNAERQNEMHDEAPNGPWGPDGGN